MASARAKWIVAGAFVLFFGLVGAIIAARIAELITGQMALLMLVALIGLWFGFGVLIAVYRFVSHLE